MEQSAIGIEGNVQNAKCKSQNEERLRPFWHDPVLLISRPFSSTGDFALRSQMLDDSQPHRRAHSDVHDRPDQHDHD
ncbi:MAG: hypothetical protein JWO87_1477 [Phycisphaerales bacterium]|nr:hypothetical protein [Phycisphaerales bacterium]